MDTVAEEVRLIKPNGQREALLEKLSSFKTDNLSVREVRARDAYIELATCAFRLLCWDKIGTSRTQLKQLTNEELEELAVLVYEKTRLAGFLQTLFLVSVPIIGWIIFFISLKKLEHGPSSHADGRYDTYWKSMRYFWWYRKVKKLSGKKFVPQLNF